MMVIGDKQKLVSALIVPAEEALKNWGAHKNLDWTNLDQMIPHDRVVKIER